ncbi:GNAT family N-acetyltransferase [Candidatus Daviesbacteria bacterium]|nr:GNAT family N-acetyltransferase [Candidatus Daviesbacteria bacterium]
MKIGSILDSESNELSVNLGISDSQIEQLLIFTHTDPEIRKFTSDFSRFPDKSSFDSWEKDKFLYTLSNNSGDLLGFIWIEQKQLPVEAENVSPKKYGLTIAVRTYGKARGKGYFKPFLEKVLTYFKQKEEYEQISDNGFWISIAKENIPSQKAFENFGFKRVASRSQIDRIFMLL